MEYKLKSLDGNTVTKTLAPATNKRMSKTLELMGMKSFSELLKGENLLQVAALRMDVGIDRKKFSEILDQVFVEGSTGIDLEEVDLRDTDGAIQDFFEQRSKNLLERSNILNKN